MTGAEPVPVPPPMPAVMKTMSAPSSDFLMSLLDSSAADAAHFGVAARAQAARQVLAELQLIVGGGDVQHLDIGVHRDELDPGQAGVNHAVDGVGAAAAAADHFDAWRTALSHLVIPVPLKFVSLKFC